jgi:hypothetical protein
MRVSEGNEKPAAEHAHAADRFAREIEGILTVAAARSQQLMGRALGHTQPVLLS